MIALTMMKQDRKASLDADSSPEPGSSAAVPASRRRKQRNARVVTRCSTGDGIALLQEKWVLHIVHALLSGPKGFNAIAREVGGCNPTTLTQRLVHLERLGVIVKGQRVGQRRASYHLTEAGAQLEDVIAAIRRWSDTHLVSTAPLQP